MPIEIPRCPYCNETLTVSTCNLSTNGITIKILKVSYTHFARGHNIAKEEAYEIEGKNITATKWE